MGINANIFWFFGAMFLIFMTLKLCKVINWPWAWVSAPLWAPFLFIFVTVFASAAIGHSVNFHFY